MIGVLFYDLLAGMKDYASRNTWWASCGEPIVPDSVPVSIDRFMELLIDFRKAEVSRLRKRKKFSSKLLQDIDARMLECARKLCEKE